MSNEDGNGEDDDEEEEDCIKDISNEDCDRLVDDVLIGARNDEDVPQDELLTAAEGAFVLGVPTDLSSSTAAVPSL